MNWKTVAQNARYEVSDGGQLRRADSKNLIGQFPNADGYMLARLSQPRKTVRVHRIVAEAFIDNPAGLPFVNHIDCIRDNNNSANLEWCTQKENLAHSQKLGRMRRDYWLGKRAPTARLTDMQASEIRAIYAAGGISQSALAAKFNTNKRTVNRIIAGATYV